MRTGCPHQNNRMGFNAFAPLLFVFFRVEFTVQIVGWLPSGMIMKSGIFGQQLTFPAHARMQTGPFFSALAVKSLRSWMTGASRFPAAWIAAVEEALILAHQQARRTAGSGTSQS